MKLCNKGRKKCDKAAAILEVEYRNLEDYQHLDRER